MKKLARFALIVTLSATYPTPSGPSFASTTPSGLPAWGPRSARFFVSPSPLSVASAAPARPSLAALSSAAPTQPNERWLNGSAGYARAVELQQELNVPLVVYFYADWCPYCRTLDSQYLSAAPVQDYLRGVVKVRINPEHGPAERALAKHYAVSGYPSFFVMRNSAARPVNVSPFRRVSNLTPTQFADACRAIVPVSVKAAAPASRKAPASVLLKAPASVSIKAPGVRSSGVSGKFRERQPDVATKKTTTGGGAQIVTVMPAAPASPRVRTRKAQP